jgi:hypothetical protein
LGRSIIEEIEAPSNVPDAAIAKWMKKKYINTWYASLKLLVDREMLLWWRDKNQIYARLAQDLIMGVIAGTLFWQGSDDPQSVMGILFQSMFFVSVGAMLKVGPQFESRSIFYKQKDSNFFPTWTYVFGRSLAGMPTSVIDGLLYGSIVFWFVGLAHNDGASIANYFMFMLLILTGSLTTGLLFSIFSTITRDRTVGQACSSIMIVVLVLFSGYTVQPNVIPSYWIWMYWINFFGWILRGLAVNEFDSGKYDEPSGVGNQTTGQAILSRFGFVDSDDVAYQFDWTWWAILFSLLVCALSVFASTYFLEHIRFATGKSLATDLGEEEEIEESESIALPFQRVDLTFRDMRYTVKASVGNEKLELLKGIDGIVEAGKMTALVSSDC